MFEHLSTSGVAREIDKSPDRVRQLARQGKLVAAIVTAQGHRIYTRAEVERYKATTRARQSADASNPEAA